MPSGAEKTFGEVRSILKQVAIMGVLLDGILPEKNKSMGFFRKVKMFHYEKMILL